MKYTNKKNNIRNFESLYNKQYNCGCISFVCSGCAEHVLANEVVRNILREQTEQSAGYTTFWGGAEGIKMAEPTIFMTIMVMLYSFFYIEFFLHLTHFPKITKYKRKAWIF